MIAKILMDFPCKAILIKGFPLRRPAIGPPPGLHKDAPLCAEYSGTNMLILESSASSRSGMNFQDVVTGGPHVNMFPSGRSSAATFLNPKPRVLVALLRFDRDILG